MENIVVIVVSIVVISYLLYLSSTSSSVKQNGFRRIFQEQAPVQIRKFSLLKNYSIASLTRDSVILYNQNHPSESLKLSISLGNSEEISYPFPKDAPKIKGINSMFFSDHDVFLLNGGTSTVYQLRKNVLIRKKQIDSVSFGQSAIISPNNFVVASRKAKRGNLRRVVKKIDTEGRLMATFLPEKQFDGYFCNDGQFKYDQESGTLIYMYFYRGTFTCLDSNLNLKYTAKTIDTVTHASIKLDYKLINLNGRKIQRVATTKPPVTINRRLCVGNGKVYIVSGVVADNEDLQQVKINEVIDVYDIRNGKYLWSFYLPKVNGAKISQFNIHQNTLAAKFRNQFVTFRIPDI